MAAHTSRAFGMSWSSSLVKLVPMLVVLVSTAGDSPVIVTVSETVARGSCASTVRVVLRPTRIPSRLSVRKPEASKVSV